MLANYRAATIRDQAESVADQLERELNSIQAHFQTFLSEAEKGGDDNRQFSNFLSHGLNKLESGTLNIHYHRPHDNLKEPEADEIESAAASAEVTGRGRLELYENDVLERVNSVHSDCIASVELAEPGGGARLCNVYKEIHEKLELKSSLFGICDFKDGLNAVEAFCTVPLNSIILFAGPFDLRFDLRTGSARKALTG